MVNPIPETVSVTLSPELRAFISAQIAAGRFGSADDYFRQLAEADERATGLARLEAELLKGLDSGPGIEFGPDFESELLGRVNQRLAQEKS